MKNCICRSRLCKKRRNSRMHSTHTQAYSGLYTCTFIKIMVMHGSKVSFSLYLSISVPLVKCILLKMNWFFCFLPFFLFSLPSRSCLNANFSWRAKKMKKLSRRDSKRTISCDHFRFLRDERLSPLDPSLRSEI